jgi:hypothetical protein
MTRKTTKPPNEENVEHIKRATRKYYLSEEKIRTFLDGLRFEDAETLSAIGAKPMVERRAVPS